MRALPGDFIVVAGRTWLMYAPIGLRIEQHREGDLGSGCRRSGRGEVPALDEEPLGTEDEQRSMSL